MSFVKSSARQAIEYSHILDAYMPGSGITFTRRWTMGVTDDIEVPGKTFAQFCVDNPDEPDRGDGRKQHYGSGRQPWDDIVEQGWAAQFAAGNVLKYLRRDKAIKTSRTKARWYFAELTKLARAATEVEAPYAVMKSLVGLLTRDELDLLGVSISYFRMKS